MATEAMEAIMQVKKTAEAQKAIHNAFTLLTRGKVWGCFRSGL